MLLTPGPTPVPAFVRRAMSVETINHRTPEFEAIFKDTRALLLELFGMSECLMIASSGTGAMESCVINLCHKKALVIDSGKFGERFGKICKALNIDHTIIKNEWNTPVDINEVLNVIKNDDSIDAIFIQVCESSAGLRHPVNDIAKEVKKINPSVTIVADGITAVGVEKIDVSNIDALLTGSQKALMLPTGLSIIGLSDDAILKIQSKQSGYYFNLASEIKKQRQNTTAYTPTVSIIIGLKEILLHLKDKGFDELYNKTALRAKSTRDTLVSIGLKIYPKIPANSMTTIYHEKSNEIRNILKYKYGVSIAGGQDELKGKIFRINHMGLVEDYEAIWVVNAIELALDELKIRKFDGTCNKVMVENLLLSSKN